MSRVLDFDASVSIYNRIQSHSRGTTYDCSRDGKYTSFLSSAGPTADSLKQWLVVFEGAPETLYEGGTFFAFLTFDDDYPFTPPTVTRALHRSHEP